MASRRIAYLVAGIAFAQCVSGCSSSAKPVTISLAASLASVTEGSEVMLSGAVSKHQAGVVVTLQKLEGSTFTNTGQQATTDAAGAYQFAYAPQSTGKTSLRVEVPDGKKVVDSAVVSVTSLAPVDLKITVVGPREVDVAKSIRLTGTIDPLITNAVVRIESSSAGTAFTATTAQVAVSGRTFTATVPAPSGSSGATSLRATIAATPVSASTASPTVSVYFANYKVDGGAYLSCVKGANAALDKFDAAEKSYNNGSVPLSKVTPYAAGFSKALKGEASCFSARTWPPSVASLIADLAAQDDVLADIENQIAKAKTLSQFNNLEGQAFSNAVAKTDADVSTIRARLGLPARS